MPGMNGLEMAENVRKHEAKNKAGQRRIPLIGLTGHEASSVNQQAKDAGFDTVVTKPIKRQNLLSLLRQYDGNIFNENE